MVVYINSRIVSKIVNNMSNIVKLVLINCNDLGEFSSTKLLLSIYSSRK